MADDFMKELGINEVKRTEKDSPAYKRAEKILDDVDLDKERIENNKKQMNKRLAGRSSTSSKTPNIKDFSKELDVIFDDNSPNVKPNANKKVGSMGKYLGNAWNAIKAAASNPVVRNAAKVAGRVALPIAATMATAQAINKGAEAYDAWQNERLVNTEVENEAMAQQEMQKLIAQGFALREALQMVRGLEVDQPSDYYKSVYGMSATPQPTVAQQSTQSVAVNKPSSLETFINKNANPNVSYVQDPSTGEVVAVPAGENLVMTGDNNNNGNNGNINNNTIMGYSPNGRLAPVPGMDEQAIQAATQPQSQGSFSPTIANPTTSVQNALAQNILSSINRTPEERMQMANQLKQVYEQYMANTAQGDPRYSGPVVTLENPYNVNTRDLKLAQDIATGYARLNSPTSVPDMLTSNATRMYQAQIANQTGVPYADYINATSERRKAQLANAQAQLKAQADMIMQSDANMDKKLEAFTKLRDIEAQMEREVVGEELQRQRELQVATLKAQADILIQDMANKGQIDLEKLKQQDMNEIAKAQGAYLNAFNWADPETKRLIMGNPEMQKFFFGSVVPPDVFNRAYPTAAQGMGLTQRQMPTININAGM